ncbi:MAG: HigA family addiction module antidote protein [Gammaproteobacteria bacterium]|nr:HigA family addiction module antidote protein [Gammaproteobacteria bacterium]
MPTRAKRTAPSRRQPTHPGAILRQDVLPALALSVTHAARDLRVTRQTLHRLLSESTSVTPDMAVRLGKFCGNGPELWMRMQAAYDLWKAERALQDQVRAIPNRARRRPRLLPGGLRGDKPTRRGVRAEAP